MLTCGPRGPFVMKLFSGLRPHRVSLKAFLKLINGKIIAHSMLLLRYFLIIFKVFFRHFNKVDFVLVFPNFTPIKIGLGVVHKLRLQKEVGRWSKNVHFLSTFIPYKNVNAGG